MTNNAPISRMFQFTLRTLLVAVLGLSLPLSWLAVKLQKVRQQTEVVRRTERVNGIVNYDWAARDDQLPWLQSLLGGDYHDTIRTISASHPDITDSHLECFEGLANLVELDLSRADVTDAGLEHLKGLTTLERLHLGGPKITDAGLQHFAGMPDLKWYLGPTAMGKLVIGGNY